MLRRLLSATALVACTGVYAFAAPERADFILTNGDRQSGTVVSSGSRYRNNGELTLATNRRDMTFRLDEIAVIEFAGGEPAPGELNRLGPEQTLVMRDGRILAGRFVALLGGDTIVWDAGRGRPEQIPIRAINRVYLNPDRARWVYNDRGRFYGRDGNGREYAGRDYQGRDQWERGEYGRDSYDRRDGRAVGTTGQSRDVQVRVEANLPWIDTGLVVNEGERVTFHASGQIAFGRGDGQVSNPDGNPSERRSTYPDPRVPVGALIGRVGNSAPFGIGMQTQPLPMPASGRLFLGVNDDERSDNSGFYTVTITRQ
jgi:hypothetical protein